MRRRKIEDDEMLVTHKPSEPEKAERETSQEPQQASVETSATELAARLAAASDPDERKELIRQIQERLGNREAERIIKTVKKTEES